MQTVQSVMATESEKGALVNAAIASHTSSSYKLAQLWLAGRERVIVKDTIYTCLGYLRCRRKYN